MFSHATSITIADTLRVVSVTELALCAGLAIAALTLYFAGNIHIRRVDPRRAGALVRYVLSMAGSYALLAAFAIAEIQGYYGTVLTWRTPIGFLAANMGVYSLVNLLMFENTRLDVRDERVITEGTPDL
jgi:hypothetical protein